MPQFGYSFNQFDSAVHVRASGREVDISPKDAREVCQSVKGLLVPAARRLLEEVVDLKRPVAFRRFKLKRGHRKELQGFATGGYPSKAAASILAVLDNLQNNAEHKGLNIDRMKIIHASAYAGRKLPRYKPRAFGRTSPSMRVFVHVELVGKEVA
ncbi:MAG: 50S ribosomal protein L22 [Nitrososphaerota archaeon]|nr:50S ribosomal protein L22 [Nitrososphaerota archaeon]MDG6939500.1 50S ribosomal protein L22 [Nitrososphaerota archaeon]